MIARVVATSTCFVIAGACQLEAVGPRQSPATWPAAEWARATPSQVGMDAAPLERLHADIVADGHGNVDQIVVVRNGYLVADRRYPRDYVETSRGRTSPIGCGADACADPADVHQYNYLHPDFHPYAGAGDVHTLQSITKSVMSARRDAAPGCLPVWLHGLALSHDLVPVGVDIPVLLTSTGSARILL